MKLRQFPLQLQVRGGELQAVHAIFRHDAIPKSMIAVGHKDLATHGALVVNSLNHSPVAPLHSKNMYDMCIVAGSREVKYGWSDYLLSLLGPA